MGSDGKYEECDLSKLSFDPECQYFTLKVPKGFDVKQLKVSYSVRYRAEKKNEFHETKQWFPLGYPLFCRRLNS